MKAMKYFSKPYIRDETSYLEVTTLLICYLTQITLYFSSNCYLIWHENVKVGRAFVEGKTKVVLIPCPVLNKGFKNWIRALDNSKDMSLQLIKLPL